MRVFIGCSANNQIDEKYKKLACEVSEYLARNDHKLIFGGSRNGMMEQCYLAFKYVGKKTKAIVDVKYSDNLDNLEVDALEITKNTFDRCYNIYRCAEVIMILPGGIGTLSELFSMLEEKRTRSSDIPIILYNYNGYYSYLIKMLNMSTDELFISEDNLSLITIVNNMDELNNVFSELERRN